MGLCGSEVLPNGTMPMASCSWELSTNRTTDIILGIIASLTTLALHLHSVPTFWRIWNAKTTWKLLPFPYMFAYWNSLAWYMYSISSHYESRPAIKFQVLCLSISSYTGMLIEYIYHAIFRHFNPGFDNFKWWAINLNLTSSLLFMSLPVSLPNLWSSAPKLMDLITGIGILMYVSPVFTIIHVSRTKLVEYLPFRLLVALCLNGLAWTIYACLPQTFNRYLAISNGVGTICSIFLLGVSYFIHFRLQKSITSGSAHDKLE